MSVSFGTSKKRQFESCPFSGDEAFRGVYLKRTRLIEIPIEAFELQDHPSNKKGHLIVLTDMFPDIDEKIISEVLDHFGDNLEFAIERLEQLRLSGNNSDSAATTAASSSSQGTTSSRLLVQQKLSKQWVENILEDLSKAKSTEEAKERFLTQLGLFETAVIENYKSNSPEMIGIKKEFEQMKKGNSILSKAVTIQHERLKEAMGKEQEINALKETLRQYQDKIRNLEFINYSLTMHLQRATGSTEQETKGPPDIF